MSELDDIKVGDWLAIVSTTMASKSSAPVLQRATAVTVGLVKTKNYTFRRDGRAFYAHYKSLTARPATETEIEKWQSRQKKQDTPQSEDVVLARYLALVSVDEWMKLGLPQLRRIKAALEKSQGK